LEAEPEGATTGSQDNHFKGNKKESIAMRTDNCFESTQEVKEALNKQNYIPSDEIATILFLSQQLGKPLLTEGPAGVGKTELAKAVAGATGKRINSVTVL
jgi:MoxR-like ATPase